MGNKEAMEKIVRANMGFAAAAAIGEYRRICGIKRIVGNLALEDLIQGAQEGLLEAVYRFTVSENVRFRTYALYWIKNKISDCIISYERSVKIPKHVLEKMSTIKRISFILRKTLNRDPSPLEISNYSDGYVTENDVHKILGIIQSEDTSNAVTIEALDYDILSPTSVEAENQVPIADESAKEEYLKMENEELLKDLKEVIKELTPEEQIIITYYYGMDGKKQHTFEALRSKMEELGYKKISKQALQVKHAKIIEKLRSKLAAHI